MAKKRGRDAVQNIINNLLDLEIPEIQSKTKKLAEQIRELEQHGLKLQDYVSQIENLAIEEASTIVEGRITEILKDLDKSLTELRQRSNKALATRPQSPALASKSDLAKKSTEQEERKVEEPEEEVALPQSELRPTTYTTPEGYIVKRSRR